MFIKNFHFKKSKTYILKIYVYIRLNSLKGYLVIEAFKQLNKHHSLLTTYGILYSQG